MAKTTEKGTLTLSKMVDYVSQLARVIKEGGSYTVSFGEYGAGLTVDKATTVPAQTMGKVLLYGGLAAGAVVLILLLKD